MVTRQTIEPSSAEPLLTMREAALVLRAHPNSIRRWINDGLLRCYRIGVRGDRRLTRQDLVEFLQ